MSRFARPAVYAALAVIATGCFSYAWAAKSTARPARSTESAKPGGQPSASVTRAQTRSAPASRGPIHYQVEPNDTLDSVAARFNVPAQQIRWSNPYALSTTNQVDPGQTLVIPPVSGVVVRVRPRDTLGSLAAAWHVGRDDILQFNGLRNPARELQPGRLLVLPGARGRQLPNSAPPPPQLPPDPSGRPVRQGGPNPGGASYNIYPEGQCTYYVATRVTIPWNGDAWTWYGSASSWGWVVGSVPRQGAIMVTMEDPDFGHVAYVEHVYSDGSWLVSEMNYLGEGIIDQRLVRPGAVPLIGFTYPPSTLGSVPRTG